MVVVVVIVVVVAVVVVVDIVIVVTMDLVVVVLHVYPFCHFNVVIVDISPWTCLPGLQAQIVR